jgi:hypothetical protein
MDNRRRSPRFVVEGVHGKLTFASQVDILNMSLGGVALLVDRRLNIGREYTLKLEVQDRAVAVQAVVVWSVLTEIRRSPTGEDIPVYSAGMKFLDVLTPRVLELVQFIDAHKIVEEHRLGGVRFHIDAPGKALLDVPHAYRVRVISSTGMLMESEHVLELDRVYPMEVALDPESPMRFSGRIASRQEKAGPGPVVYETGVEFMDITPDDRARLGRFIEALSRRE